MCVSASVARLPPPLGRFDALYSASLSGRAEDRQSVVAVKRDVGEPGGA